MNVANCIHETHLMIAACTMIHPERVLVVTGAVVGANLDPSINDRLPASSTAAGVR